MASAVRPGLRRWGRCVWPFGRGGGAAPPRRVGCGPPPPATGGRAARVRVPERENWVARGLSNTEIAGTLVVAERAVKTHMTRPQVRPRTWHPGVTCGPPPAPYPPRSLHQPQACARLRRADPCDAPVTFGMNP
ncbi:LuxR C-terminal-related transcriptional regulator [Streptomyces coeruleorubidus]|uniref:LuxR C-terminal-related transcriptional regulator n=1 Tax=Streptomyces coeruleorubidus TaxID=116188 RepID=UPI0037031059